MSAIFTETILSGLGLDHYFDFILASFVVGVAKPDPRWVVPAKGSITCIQLHLHKYDIYTVLLLYMCSIFQIAMERANVRAEDTWHIGDNLVRIS